MMMRMLSMVIRYRSMVGFLCASILFTSCVRSQKSGLIKIERNPCSELELAERNYKHMKQPRSEVQELLRGMRQRINTLQQECKSYKEQVSRYVNQFGYSAAEADRLAAQSVRSDRTHRVKTDNSSVGTVDAVVLGVAAIGILTFITVVAYDLSKRQ